MAQLKDLLVTGAARFLNGVLVTGTSSTNDINPFANDTSSLGTSSLKWKNIYVNNLYSGPATFSGSVSPSGTQNLGASNAKWNNLYVNTVTSTTLDNSGNYKWYGGKNFELIATANNQEWSFDLGSSSTSYTGTYAHFWSAKNQQTIMAFYADTNEVRIPSTGYMGIGGAGDSTYKLKVTGNANISTILNAQKIYVNLTPSPYSSTSAYSVGNRVYYNNLIYKCTTAIASGGEAWNSAHWTQDTYSQYLNGSLGIRENALAIDFRPGSSNYTTHMSYQTTGNEALVLGTQSAVTSLIFINGESASNISSSRWQSLVPALQIKKNSISIGELIAQDVNPTFKMLVNGPAATTTNRTSQLVISESGGGIVALELWRGDNGSWQIRNESASLYFNSNWNSTKQTTYSVSSLKLYSTTGAGSIPYLAVGQVESNTSYQLYVNGTTRFYRESTTADNLPAVLEFANKDTTLTKTGVAAIRVYNDHNNSNGTNMVITSGGNMFIGGGEAPASLYAKKTSDSGENGYFISDTNSYIYAKADTVDNRIGFQVNTSGHVIPVKAESNNTNLQNLGSQDSRWAKLYVGTADSYGNSNTPIYWNAGVPKAVNVPTSGAWWSSVPQIGSDGVMEIGKYIDFHVTNNGTTDYDARITAATTGLTLSGTTTGTFSGNLTGNASTATKLATARTLTIGSTGKTFDGSANVSWTLAEIGAAPASHSHKWTDITDPPTIASAWADITGKPSTFTPASHTHPGSDITSTVASATYLQGVTSSSAIPTADPGAGKIGYYYNVNTGLTGNMPTTNNANGILQINKHSGNYVSQLGFSSDGNIYYRSFNGTAINTTTTWQKVAFIGHTHSYLPLSGGTLTGNITITNGNPYILLLDTNASYATNFYLQEYQGQLYLGAGVNNSVNISSVGAVTSPAIRGGMWITGTHECTFFSSKATTASAGSYYQGHYGLKTPAGAWSLGILSGSNDLYFVYGTDANYSASSNTTNTTVRIASNGGLYGAVWNDYAEYRETNTIEAGRVVVENGDDTLNISIDRLQRGCAITSDTFGFAMGETDNAKTPIAVSGRVLAYPYEDREVFRTHIGWPVCSGPNGTVSLMTEEEEEKYPSRILGIVSAVPDYEVWGTGNVQVNNRVWITIK